MLYKAYQSLDFDEIVTSGKHIDQSKDIWVETPAWTGVYQPSIAEPPESRRKHIQDTLAKKHIEIFANHCDATRCVVGVPADQVVGFNIGLVLASKSALRKQT